MLEITLHDGPARLGKWRNSKTPLLVPYEDLSLVEDQPMPYNVPRELAEWSVEKTVSSARNSNNDSMAVIHGARYLELRKQCALDLENLGYRNFLLANIDELLKRPHDLVNMLVGIREVLNPNSALYRPFCSPNFIPLLSYMGIDLFGDASAGFYARLGMMITPDSTYNLQQYAIYSLEYPKLVEYNLHTLDFVVREVRENMKHGTLRNLVEMRCASSPETMAALRILDHEYSEFLNRYTQLY
jgi:7-cyano-7-deazaguanine tRNA-ribosyltransferase